jgi:hypothetical protein
MKHIPSHFCFKIAITVGKSSSKILATSVVFKKAQRKQLPNRRKFAQSGHPGFEPSEYLPEVWQVLIANLSCV